jgi:hypothetical protein
VHGTDRIRKKYPQNLPGEESEQIESHEETVAKDDLPNESMKTDNFFHSVLEYPCPTILRDMCNATWHAILNIQRGCNLSSQHHITPNKKKRAPMQIVETGFPMERIAMDILCELPETSGWHAILNIQRCCNLSSQHHIIRSVSRCFMLCGSISH